MGVEGTLALGYGAGEVIPILAALTWKEITRLCCLCISKSCLCGPCSFLSVGALRLEGTELLVSLGKKGLGSCLQLGPGLSAS